MARIGGIAKCLFFPTPVEVVKLIAKYVRLKDGIASVFDPCCGAGEAVATFADLLPGCRPYGNELDESRAAKAGNLIEDITQGPMEFFETDGKFSVMFFNPPYDDGPNGTRLEEFYFYKMDEFLADNGLFIGIVPEKIACDYTKFSERLWQRYGRVMVRRFPKGLYERFNQVVVFATKLSEEDCECNKATSWWLDRSNFQKEWNLYHKELSEGDAGQNVYDVLYAPFPKYTRITLPSEQEILKEVTEHGVTTTKNWELATSMVRMSTEFQPLMPLREGHMAQLLAAGFMDGMQVDNLLIKGYTTKYLEKEEVDEDEDITEDDNGNLIKEEHAREVLNYGITTFDMSTGKFENIEYKTNKERYNNFLLKNASSLAEHMKVQYKSYFDCEKDYPEFGGVLNALSSPGKLLPGQIEPGLLDAQKAVAASVAKMLKHKQKNAILVGEMGSGKTTISVAIVASYYYNRLLEGKSAMCVVFCPPHLVKKWAREIENTLAPMRAKAFVCKRPSDVDRAFARQGLTFIVMSEQSAKNHSRWTPAYNTRPNKTLLVRDKNDGKVKSQMHYMTCPKCGDYIYDDTDTLNEGTSRRKLYTEYGDVHWLEKKQRSCEFCGEPLWQRIPFKKGGRVALAHYINKKYAGKYFLIIDETHRVKGADTDIGYASLDLCATAKKILAMTGTIYGGKASTLFYLLYRMSESFRLLFDYNEVTRFVEQFGLVEHIVKSKADKCSWGSGHYGYKRVNERIREIPGTSPAMVGLILPYTVFLRLADLGMYLPKYTETYEGITMNPELEEDYTEVKALEEIAVEKAQHGSLGIFSAYMQLALGRPDCPTQEEYIPGVYDTDEPGEKLPFTMNPIPIPEGGFTKDVSLIERIKGEVSEGRNVIVYCGQVNKRNPQPRLKKMLENEGIKVSVLRANTVSTEDREEWLADEVAKGCQVLLTNCRLVETGLDLLDFPTMVYLNVDYSVYAVRQSCRRSWRLGQDKEVKIHFMFYKDTLQETGLHLLASKLRASGYVDGNLAEGLAAMSEDSDGFMKQLMKSVMTGEHIKGAIDEHVEFGLGDGGHYYELPYVKPLPLADIFRNVRPYRKTVQVSEEQAEELLSFFFVEEETEETATEENTSFDAFLGQLLGADDTEDDDMVELVFGDM